MTSVTAWNSIDGLPKQFLTSLRILFDILDEKKCGYVRLQDIETRWHEEGVQGLPSGVTDALRKVAPPNGYLSFERFVSGLKLALLTSKTKVTGNRGIQNREKENIVNNSDHGHGGGGKHSHRLPPSGNTNIEESDNSKDKNLRKRLPSNSEISSLKDQRQRLPSNSELTNSKEISQTQRRPVQNVLYNSTNQRSHNANNPTATVRPNNVQGQSTWRNPQNHDTIIDPSAPSREVHHKVQTGLPPPRPERLSPHNSLPDSQLPPTIPPRGDTSKLIINELKNWQRRMNRTPHDKANSDSKLLDQNSAQSDIYVNIAQLNVSDHGPASSSHPKSASVKRRDSARRHTLSSGVDTNMIKRVRQLEEEKQILLQGLAMVDQARVWYLKQINLMEEKQKYVSKASHSDYNLEAMQERMNFEKARITEVNHQIKTLVESTEKGFPLHMNLAMTSSNQRLEQNTVRLIKDQNRQLTKEISQKSDKITQLEQEKASLIRDLFEARSQNKTNYDDTTFM